MSDESSIPNIPNLPLVGNPYSLTKKAWGYVKPVAAPLVPAVKPLVDLAVKIVKPVARPALAQVGITEFKGELKSRARI